MRMARCGKTIRNSWFLVGFALPLWANPIVSFAGKHIHIEGVTPGSSVAILSVAHEPVYYMTRVVCRSVMVDDADRDGVVDYDLNATVAFRSIWIVTDVASGTTTVAAPTGYEPRTMKQKGAGRGNAMNILPNALDIGRDMAQVVLVRPGKSAWTIGVRGEHGAGNPAAANGRAHVDIASMRPIRANGEAAPGVLKRGDVVAVIDPERMEYLLTTVDQGGN